MNPQALLSGIITELRTLGDQAGDIEELTKETAKAQARLDALKRDLASWKQEIVEAKHSRDRYLNEAREKLAESERLDKEIKAKREEVSTLNDWINKIRIQLG
jgi:DNA repair exonuclease SbcCD ATPase subunit